MKIARRAGAIAFFWALTWVVLAGAWLLYVDNASLPELVAGAVAAAIGATASELVRTQRIAEVRPHIRNLRRVWRPIVRAPLDVAIVLGAIARQVIRPRPQRGRLRVLAFDPGGDDPNSNARRALAEGLGSFAPNTIVIGIDGESESILVHQLVATSDGARAADPMELG